MQIGTVDLNKLRGISDKAFGLAKEALGDFSWALPAGRISGLLGPNGAGKTTLFRLLMGILKPTKGTIRVAGRPVTGAGPYQLGTSVPGSSYTYVPNPHYYNQSAVHWSKVVIRVITSPQSMVFGVIPVAILGLAFYVFVVAIMSPWAWRTRRREVHLLRLVSMAVGMGFVMYLIYAELYQIGSWCLYCTIVHIITFLLFCITVVSAAIWGMGAPKKAP